MPFYPGVNLGNYRFGFGDRQPPNNATTDCGMTYYNRQTMVTALQTGTLTSDTDFGWLFHELQHFRQCQQVGGRDAYALMWFGELQTTFIQNADLATLHDRMPMEGDAATVASGVLASTRSLRDVNGRLVRPIAVSFANAAGTTLGTSYATTPGTVQRITAQVTGGSNPLTRTWTWRTPGSTTYSAPPAANIVDNGNTFQFTPPATGTYDVRVRVSQTGSNLVPATRTVTINVIAPRLPRF